MMTVRNAIDMHIHSYPCLFPRIADDRGIAEAAAGAGLGAIVLKCHHESTVSRAHALDGVYGGLRVFGGIVLNGHVGGLNPAAVESALRLGGKIVWMPTTDVVYHSTVYGSRGRYDVQESGQDQSVDGGITVLGPDSRLLPRVVDIVALIAQYGAVLATSHLSPQEAAVLVPEARRMGVERVVVTHPFFKVPAYTLDQLRHLVEQGAFAEFGYCTVSPMWAYVKLDQIVQAIRALGPERCTLVSDGGQRHNPMPHESLRVFMQCLNEKGVPVDQLRMMVEANPRKLLDI